ncbi:MAG: hypothetical protein AUG74_15270 [Bacteroidetes bacterium 13_1_20CM_4_60_6]|nr:MAG: hypothetical protein AUG74_15270 [Bacteroidetes bacterium 13_1_20CM_4_60_6]
MLPHINRHQFTFQNIGKFHYSFVIASTCIFGFGGKNRNAIINAVLQSKLMMPKAEFPAYGVKIIFFMTKINFKIISKNIGNLVKAFQAAIIVDHCFCAT